MSSRDKYSDFQGLIYAGRSGIKDFAEEVCGLLGVSLGEVEWHDFSNGNYLPDFPQTSRGKKVYVFQTGVRSGFENKEIARQVVSMDLLELLILIDTLKYNSAKDITAIIPYFPFVRSDKKDEPRIPISARTTCEFLESAGARRIVSMDLHSMQVQGFSRVPFDQLFASSVMIDNLVERRLVEITIVSPDLGSAPRARYFARALSRHFAREKIDVEIPVSIVDKERIGHEEKVRIKGIYGAEHLKHRTALVIDDEIGSGETLFETAKKLLEMEAEEVRAAIPFPVLTGEALENLEQSPIKELITTNAIPLKRGSGKVTVLSVAPLFAEVLWRIDTGRSISEIFEKH